MFVGAAGVDVVGAAGRAGVGVGWAAGLCAETVTTATTINKTALTKLYFFIDLAIKASAVIRGLLLAKRLRVQFKLWLGYRRCCRVLAIEISNKCLRDVDTISGIHHWNLAAIYDDGDSPGFGKRLKSLADIFL